MQTIDGREEESSTTDELDQRLWPRAEGDVAEAVLWTSVKESQPVKILDESQTGIAVLVNDASQLYPDCEVRLVFRGEPMWALVRNVGPEEDGKRRIGLEWGCSNNRVAPLDFPTGDLP